MARTATRSAPDLRRLTTSRPAVLIIGIAIGFLLSRLAAVGPDREPVTSTAPVTATTSPSPPPSEVRAVTGPSNGPLGSTRSYDDEGTRDTLTTVSTWSSPRVRK